LPDPNEIGIGNWLDLLIVRSGLPNVNAAEQARIDHYVPNYMPFVQPSLLDTVFKIPLGERRGGRLFRHMIDANERKLASFPLVFVDCVVPYRFTTIPVYILRRLKQKFRKAYQDNLLDRFLDRTRTMIEDLANSSSIQQSGLYNSVKVRAIIDGYYGGNRTLGPQLNWWLGFELWRRALYKN
jgi:hypothetical protein